MPLPRGLVIRSHSLPICFPCLCYYEPLCEVTAPHDTSAVEERYRYEDLGAMAERRPRGRAQIRTAVA